MAGWRCEVAASEAGVRVTVRNTGSGIPADLRERIFQPFFTTKATGTGLGLAIARQIVDAHRGRIEVMSDGVSETTFVVELPARAPAALAPEAPAASKRPSSTRKRRVRTAMAERIVIAEDDEDLAFVLREALIRKQYEVEVAPTAGALLDRLQGGRLRPGPARREAAGHGRPRRPAQVPRAGPGDADHRDDRPRHARRSRWRRSRAGRTTSSPSRSRWPSSRWWWRARWTAAGSSSRSRCSGPGRPRASRRSSGSASRSSACSTWPSARRRRT